MLEKNTKDIIVKVDTRFEVKHSSPENGQYFYSYHITITNMSESRVQLLRRCWYINDYIAFNKKVEGEGVIGKQPVIEPGETISYTSYCELVSGMGEMHGYYTFINYADGTEFSVEVPRFELMQPWILN